MLANKIHTMLGRKARSGKFLTDGDVTRRQGLQTLDELSGDRGRDESCCSAVRDCFNDKSNDGSEYEMTNN